MATCCIMPRNPSLADFDRTHKGACLEGQYKDVGNLVVLKTPRDEPGLLARGTGVFQNPKTCVGESSRKGLS